MLDIAGFYNAINNYIFISPIGETTSTGINKYLYQQADTYLAGGEAGIHYHPELMKWLSFEPTFSVVVGKKKNGEYLPFIPAHKFQMDLRAEKDNILFFQKAFISVFTNTAFNQYKAAPEETATSGYTIINMTTGGNIKIQNQPFSVSISVTNLLDKKYIDHLSTLKEVGLFNPGRNIAFILKIPFEANLK